MSGVRQLTDDERWFYQVTRIAAVETMPYFASALFSLQPLAHPGLGTWAVDRYWRIYLDPDLLTGDTWTAQEKAGVLLHEVGHVLRIHADRAAALPIQPYNHNLWNYCADAEINDDLLDGGVTLPDGLVTPQWLGCDPHETAETYYQQLFTPPDDSGAGDNGDGGSNGGDAGGGGGLGDDDDDDPGCGSGSGSIAIPGEVTQGTTVDGQVGVDQATGKVIIRRIAEDIRNGSGRGHIPAGLRRWADGVLAPPQLPWDRLLRSAVRRCVAWAAGRTDYTYRKPSRRRVPNVVTPSMHGPKVSIAEVIDTSGSMSEAALRAALSETNGVLRSSGVGRERVTVMTCDAATGTPQRVSRAHKITLTGGGGTDMRIGIEAAMALRPAPNVVIVMSDGDTEWPDRPLRNAKLICVIIGNPAAAQRTPKWAVTVNVPDSAQERGAA